MLTAAILLAWIFYTVLHTLLTAGGAAALGVPIKQVNIGLGPVLLRRQMPRFDFSLCLLPFAGYVAFGDRRSDEDETTAASLLSSLPLGQRLGVTLIGPASNGILGLILILTGSADSIVAGGAMILCLVLFNLLPFPALNGFEMLTALLPPLRHRDWTQTLPQWAITSSFLFAIGAQTVLFWLALMRPQGFVEIGRAIAASLIRS